MLTDEKIAEIRDVVEEENKSTGDWSVDPFKFGRAIEAAVREEMAKQEPVAWTFTGSNRLMDEYEANLEAKRCGGTTRAFPLYAAPVVPYDMVMVPREPTEAMIDAGWSVEELVTPAKTWRAMIAAAEKQNARS